MLIKKVVINSSPIIVLFKSQQADLLPQLFEKIFVPQGVWDEIINTSKNDLASQQLPHVDWVRKVEISSVEPEIAAWDLGKGESEVLSLALKAVNYKVIIGDRAARRCAKSFGIITLGIGGIILLFKTTGNY